MCRVVDQEEFRERLIETLKGCRALSVTGPGRSGAIASVYASHVLGIPWLPFGQVCPPQLRPLLIIDTATKTGKTLRYAHRDYGNDCILLAVYQEPPRVRFWYEIIKEKS